MSTDTERMKNILQDIFRRLSNSIGPESLNLKEIDTLANVAKTYAALENLTDKTGWD